MTTPPSNRVAAFRVLINGNQLPQATVEDIISINVVQDTEFTSVATICFVNWDLSRTQVTNSDNTLLAEGNEIEIEMGYVDSTATVFSGEITGIEPVFVASEIPTVTIRSYDLRHRLMRYRRTRSFTNVSDGDIVNNIGTEWGLVVDVIDPGIIHEYLLQHNQTDFEFLQQRAACYGYEFFIVQRTLCFRPPPYSAEPTVTLQRENDLLSFRCRLTTMGQIGETAIRYWDPINKEAYESIESQGDSAAILAGNQTGHETSVAAFSGPSGSRSGICTMPIRSHDEAGALSKGMFRTMEYSYVTGDGECLGRTDIIAGDVLCIEGLGRRFSGEYYIQSAIHRYFPQVGYRTSFKVRRNSS